MRPASSPVELLSRYFYFFMSLLIAAVVAFGFGQTVNGHFFHPSHPLPSLLTLHAAIFSAWVIFYIAQSALVRTGNVRIHRRLGWFGVALGTAIPVIGVITAVTMRRFDLHYPDLAPTAPCFVPPSWICPPLQFLLPWPSTGAGSRNSIAVLS